MTTAPPPSDRMAGAARVLGIVAVVASVLPLLSYVAWAVGIAAVAVAIVALARATGRRGAATAGLVLGVVALILGIVASVVYTVLVAVAVVSSVHAGGTGTPIGPAPSHGPAGGIVWRVTGGGTASVDYGVASGSSAVQDQVAPAALPWEQSAALDDGEDVRFSLTAQRTSGSGRITCTVLVDGAVVSRDSATGSAASVTCTGASG